MFYPSGAGLHAHFYPEGYTTTDTLRQWSVCRAVDVPSSNGWITQLLMNSMLFNIAELTLGQVILEAEYWFRRQIQSAVSHATRSRTNIDRSLNIYNDAMIFLKSLY